MGYGWVSVSKNSPTPQQIISLYWKIVNKLVVHDSKNLYKMVNSGCNSTTHGLWLAVARWRNRHPAFSGKRKPKRPMVLLLNVHVASLFCFYSQMNSLEEG